MSERWVVAASWLLAVCELRHCWSLYPFLFDLLETPQDFRKARVSRTLSRFWRGKTACESECGSLVIRVIPVKLFSNQVTLARGPNLCGNGQEG